MSKKLNFILWWCIIISCGGILIACQYSIDDSTMSTGVPIARQTVTYSTSQSQPISTQEPTHPSTVRPPLSLTETVSQASTATLTPVSSFVLPTVVSPVLYIDPTIGFSLKYPGTWQLEMRDGTNINDGSGHTIILEQEGYQVWLQAQFRPDEPGDCAGVLSDDLASSVWIFHVNGMELWRVKSETGYFNSHDGIDEQNTYTIIVSPILIRGSDLPNAFTCSLEISNKIFSIMYVFPVSSETLEAGDHNKQLVAEMDYILTSIQWDVPLNEDVSPVTAVTPHPTSELDVNKDLTSPGIVLKWFQHGLE